MTAQDINTVAGLVAPDAKSLRRRYGVVERTVQELRGIPCAELEPMAQAKQQIICSRSFGKRITEFGPMREALAGYMERSAEKLRAEGMYCCHVTVFIRSSPFAEWETHYANQISTRLPIPTADTRELLAQIEFLLHRIWRDDVRYMKGGVMLADFSPKGIQQ
ncbi:UNVERIFIED_CONTAM: protein UmuC [Aeromonas salmonicida]